MTKNMRRRVNQLLEEYDANKLKCYHLRKNCEFNPTPAKMEELGAFLLWQSSLRMQLFQIYFAAIEYKKAHGATETALEGV